jgi:GT2 family glycosyltransferase
MSSFSIMIMSHDNHALLQECVNRLQKYTPFPFEIIIIDDLSNPPYDAKGATVIRMPKRSNCCNLRNVGMEMATTDYVFWVDNDTMVGENWYKPMIDKVESDPLIGLTGQPKDSRLIRNPFLPLNQSDCMIEYEFAYDFNHKNGECDFITSYCVLVKRSAYRPTFCYDMPTPCLDPELGAVVKVNGYKVAVTDEPINVYHIGSNTPRPGGREYLNHLAENFTRWYKFWEPHASKIFELYKGIPVEYEQDAFEPGRNNSRNTHGDLDKDIYWDPISQKKKEDLLTIGV